MPPASKSNTWKAALSSRWFLVGGLALIIVLSIGFARSWYQQYQIHQEINQLQTQARRLESKQIETLRLLQYVSSTAYVEKEARTALNLVKEGENVAIVARSTSGIATTFNAPPSRIDRSVSNVRKWWKYFIH